MYSKKALYTAILAAIVAQPTIAQDTEEPIEEIVVQGIRGSLTKALEIKRSSTQIVDSIVAEDIGKFPDNNVVESLQRVTGVQVTGRGAGEVSTVSIRGLNDVHTTVNGRDIFTGAGRAVSLQDIPASLLSNVTVYKTRSAEQVERGIAGSINIKTHRPFDFSDTKVVLAARGIYADQPDKIDPNISALFSNRWDTSAGEFGALINLSYVETNYRDDTITAGAVFPFFTADPHFAYSPYERMPNNHTDESRIWQAGLENGLPYTPGSTLTVGGEPTEYLLMRDAIFGTSFTGNRERPAASVSFQWAPNDELEILAEGFYTGYRNSSQNAMWFSNTFENDEGNINIPEVYEGTIIVKEHQGRNNGGFQSGDYTYGETDSYLYALGAKWQPTDNLTVNSELLYQDSEYTTDFFAMRFTRTAPGLDVDYNNRDGIPSIVFWDDAATAVDESDMAAVENWNASTIYDVGGGNSGDATTFTLDAEWELDGNVIKTIKVGGRYETRAAQEFTRGQEATPADPTTLSELMQQLAEAGASGDGSGIVFKVEDYFAGRADVFESFIAADGSYLLDNAEAARAVYGLATEDVYKTFDIEETSAAAFITSKFNIGESISGELGVRYVSYEQDMQFWAEQVAQSNTYDYSEGTNDTDKFLPSLVVSWDVTNDLVARFAYTQTLRMPEFASLNAQRYWTDPLTDVPYGTGTGGNPSLQPTESANYDLSLEWYFAEGSSLYGTVFKRELEGMILPGYSTVVREGSDGVTRPYVLNAPINAAKGELSGLEVGLVYFPDYLPEQLDGLGVQASFTLLDSTQQTPTFSEDGSLQGYIDSNMSGVSDSSYSVVLAYDRDTFDARLSYVWREEFFAGNEAAIFANPLQWWDRPEQSLDFQLSYDVTDNFMVTFDATNLLDDVYQRYYGEGNQNLFNFGSGIYSKTYALGIRYSM